MNVGKKNFNDTMSNIKGQQANRKRISDLRIRTPDSNNELEWLSGSNGSPAVMCGPDKEEDKNEDSVAKVKRSPSDNVEMSFPDFPADDDFVEQGDLVQHSPYMPPSSMQSHILKRHETDKKRQQ